MAWWYLHRMLLLLELVACISANNDTDQYQVCQLPLNQHPRVPWQHLLKKTMYYFSGLKYRNMILVLPNNSFVSGTYVKVCTGDPTNIIAHGIWLRFAFTLRYFLQYACLGHFVTTSAISFNDASRHGYNHMVISETMRSLRICVNSVEYLKMTTKHDPVYNCREWLHVTGFAHNDNYFCHYWF